MLTKHLFLTFAAATLPFVSAFPTKRPHLDERGSSGAWNSSSSSSTSTSPKWSGTSSSTSTSPNWPGASSSTSTSPDWSGTSSSSSTSPNWSGTSSSSSPSPTASAGTSTSSNSTSSTGAGNSSTSTSSSSSNDVVISAWYPGWLSATYPPDTVSWSKYNTMTFSFAVPAADGTLNIDATSQAALPTFVSEAKKNNVTALVSIGGWAGSQYFSTVMSTAAGRTAFVQSVLGLASQYSLDGVDFDWEYPGKAGDSSNVVSSADSDNFLLFLQELRQDPAGSKLVLSAAVGLTPFAGTDGQPKSDVSGFAGVLDFIAIMAYDIWGSWSSSVGPNAPLYDSCSANGVGSGDTAVKAWTAANFPVNQIVLGLPSYGRGYTVQQSEASKIGNYPAFDASLIPAGDEDTGTTASSTNSGLFNFRGLVKDGYLNADGTAADGVTYKFDDCSQTPFIYKSSTQTMISYDDATSFTSKTNYVKTQGLKGVAIWQSDGDSNNLLIDAVRSVI